MVLGIKRRDINKGRTDGTFLKGRRSDFVLAIGNDWTDEDTFKAMPAHAYTVRVGYSFTVASYNIKGPKEVRALLQKLL